MSAAGPVTSGRAPISPEEYHKWGDTIARLPVDVLGALSVFLANDELEGLGGLLRKAKVLDGEQVTAIFREKMSAANPLPPRLYATLIKHLPERLKLRTGFDHQLTRRSTFKRGLVSPEDVQKMASRFINLRSLSYRESTSDAGLIPLSALPLQELKIIHCEQVTDIALVCLKSLPLQSLTLSFCANITDQGLAHLSGLPFLQSLDIAGSLRLTHAGLAHLSQLPLQSLDLSFCAGITDPGLAHLSSLPLRSLSLSYCLQLTNAGLAHLSQLPITKLNLLGCPLVTSAGIARLLEVLTKQGNGRVKTPKGSYSKIPIEINH